MRITGGRSRGIILSTIAESILRPATDFLREAIFSSLGSVVEGGTFLDLFAGVGSYGLEALSRGAQYGVFVEQNRKISQALAKNLEAVCKSMGGENLSKIQFLDVFKINFTEKFELIFIDPPYELARTKGAEILSFASRFFSDSGRGRVVFEMPVDIDLAAPFGLKCIKRIAKSGRNSPAANIYARA